MTFTGAMADVNAALNGMSFDPTAGYVGAATVEISTDDQGNTGSGGALSDTDVVNVTVDPPPNIMVTTAADELNTDGDCSLREAIQAINNGSAVDGCVAQSYTTVELPAGTYTLSIGGTGEDANATGDLDITANLTINGAGAGSTVIDGGGVDRVMELHNSPTVTLAGVTISGGSLANHGGGLYFWNGTLNVEDSTFSGNASTWGYGGGIFTQYGAVNVENSTFAGNYAAWYGGAVYSDGGGIVNYGSLTVENNSLIDGNFGIGSGGGIWSDTNTTVTIDNSLTGWGGGINVAGGTLNMHNSIAANNITWNGGPDCTGTSQGYNLIEDTAGCTVAGDTTGNITGSDPMLDPLANVGGTQVASPAVDAGNPAAAATPAQPPRAR